MTAGPVLAFDLGGTRLKAGLVEGGRVLGGSAEPLAGHDPAAVLAQVVETGRRLVSTTPVAAVGAAVKGVIDPEAGTVLEVNEPLSGLGGRRLGAELEEAFGVPAAIENDARLFAYGELLHGAGRGTAHLVGVTLGTGVGVGVIVDGRLLSGGRGCVAGHITIDRNGPPCTCGSRGCIEAVLQRDGPEPEVLGAAITAWVNAYWPDLVVLGGGLSRSPRLDLSAVRAIVAERAWSVPRGRVRIEVSALGDDAALLGAAALASARTP